MTLLTTQQMMKKLGISRSTLIKRKNECMHSPFKDAVIYDSPRRIYYDYDRWQEYMQYRSDKRLEEMYGIKGAGLRNSRRFA